MNRQKEVSTKEIEQYIYYTYSEYIDPMTEELNLTGLGEDVINHFDLHSDYEGEEDIHELVFFICESMWLV